MYNYLHDFVQLRSSFLCFLEFLSFSSLSKLCLGVARTLSSLYPACLTRRALRIPRLSAHIFRDISKIPRKQSYTCIIPYACLLETNLKVGNKLRIYEIENIISACYRFLSLAHSLIRTRASHHSLSLAEFAMPPSHLENVSYLIPYTQRRTRPTNGERILHSQ